MHKFRMKLGTSKIVIFVLIALICVATATVNIIMSAVNAEDGIGWFSVFSSVIMYLIAAWSVLIAFFSRYTISKGRFKLTLGGISTSFPVENILLVRTNPEKTVWLLYYKFTLKKTGEEKVQQLSITAYDPESLTKAVLDANPQAVFEIFDESKNTDKDDDAK